MVEGRWSRGIPPPVATIVVRYRFSEFTLSPQRRVLVRNGQEVPLIPRYFDLLLLLIERRREAVHRREIFERVWGDVTVSDSALSQAVRTIRRTLDDDPREPRFIRTVSRHGYRFVFPEVIEEAEESDLRPGPPSATQAPAAPPEPAEMADLLWPGAAAGGATAGVVAGTLGGLILAAAPGSTAPLALAPVLAVIAGVAGGLGGLGVGAGLWLAETHARSYRVLALTAAAALGGGIVGTAVQWLTRWALVVLVGLDLDVGGGMEGLAIGGCAGLAIALATRHEDGRLVAAPGRTSWQVAIITAVGCGLAGLALTLAGRPLAGGTIHAIADAAEGSRATLAPLGRLIGEPGFGPLSRAIAAVGECAMFGLGLGLGLMRAFRG